MTTVLDYLEKLPAERRAAMDRVVDVVRRHLPEGYEEVVQKDMVVYQVPLARYPDTYNGNPLWYVALAAQKNYLSLYLMPAYGDPVLAQRLEDAFAASGRKLDMGKSCIRFRSADDLELDAIAEVVASKPVEQWIEIARSARGRRS